VAYRKKSIYYGFLLPHVYSSLRAILGAGVSFKKTGKKIKKEECALRRNRKFMYNAMRLRRSRQGFSGFLPTSNFLRLLEEAHQRNMRWYLPPNSPLLLSLETVKIIRMIITLAKKDRITEEGVLK